MREYDRKEIIIAKIDKKLKEIKGEQEDKKIQEGLC